jgi:16S rRNA processing protein RimM
MEDLIIIGKIIKEWGIRGEVIVLPLTFNCERFNNLKNIFIEKENVTESKEILHVKPHKNRLLLKIKDWDSPEEAKKYRGALIKIKRSESPKLPPDTYYHYDIIGMNVYTVSGVHLGKIDSIIESSSNDVYVIKKDKEEYLIPAIKDVIKEIDLVAKKMIVQLIEETEAI